MEERIAGKKVGADLARIDIETPYLLLGHMMFGEAEAREYVGDGPVNSDDLPIIEFSAPRNRDSYRHEEILQSMLEAFPRYQSYPLIGHISSVENTIDFSLGKLRFTSPISWQSGVASMVRTVVESDKLEEVEGPLVAYRLEAKMLGADGEELHMVAFSRAAFPEERLKLTMERLSPGLLEIGKSEVRGETAYWATYEVGRPTAALSWFYPPNRLQYLLRIVGTASESPSHLRDLLLAGATCDDFIRR
jgi:hypothetical protein